MLIIIKTTNKARIIALLIVITLIRAAVNKLLQITSFFSTVLGK